MGARTTALSVLIACRRQGAFSDGALKEYARRDGLDRRDAALAARLCYGVEQNRGLLDFYLSRFVRGKLKDLQPVVLDILRLGAYQIVFLDKVPDAAAFCPEWEQAFDAVIADVPCSGLGVIRKKPDIRYKDVSQLAGLPRVQAAILENVSRYVRLGGVLLYSTCTVLKRENEDIVNAFLAAHPEFHPECFDAPEGAGLGDVPMATLLPQKHGTDGFFICKLRRDA